MKNRYNSLVREKAVVQEELIKSEEEKLKVSKALIELQIKNSQLNEMIQNNTYEVNTKLMHAESDLMEQAIKDERATKAIKSLTE